MLQYKRESEKPAKPAKAAAKRRNDENQHPQPEAKKPKPAVPASTSHVQSSNLAPLPPMASASAVPTPLATSEATQKHTAIPSQNLDKPAIISAAGGAAPDPGVGKHVSCKDRGTTIFKGTVTGASKFQLEN